MEVKIDTEVCIEIEILYQYTIKLLFSLEKEQRSDRYYNMDKP